MGKLFTKLLDTCHAPNTQLTINYYFYRNNNNNHNNKLIISVQKIIPGYRIKTSGVKSPARRFDLKR